MTIKEWVKSICPRDTEEGKMVVQQFYEESLLTQVIRVFDFVVFWCIIILPFLGMWTQELEAIGVGIVLFLVRWIGIQKYLQENRKKG